MSRKRRAMDERTLAVIGAELSLRGVPGLREAWTGPLGASLAPAPETRDHPPTPVLELARRALEEGGCTGPTRPVHRIGLALASPDPALAARLAGDLALQGPVSDHRGFGEALREARSSLEGYACDAMLLVAAAERGAAALVLRRFREAWRARLELYALLRPEPPATDRISAVEHAGPLGEPPPGLASPCWIGSCSPERSDALDGAVGLTRLALALHDRLLPGSFPNGRPGPPAEGPFYAVESARPWFHGDDLQRRRALFVQDGEAVHLEEPPDPTLATVRRRADRWPSELFLFAADSREELRDRVRRARDLAPGTAHLADLAAGLARLAPGGLHRLAVVASTGEELAERLDAALGRLADPACTRLALHSGTYYGEGPEPEGLVAFVFPGQGSQYPNMLLDVATAFPSAQAWFDRFDEGRPPGTPPPSQYLFPVEGAPLEEDRHLLLMGEEGAEGVTVSCIGMHELLESFGLEPDVIAGYSIGELGALHAAGVLRVERGQLVQLMGELTRERTPGGRSRFPSLAVTVTDRSILDRVVAEATEPLYLALDSCPGQAVLSGTEGAVNRAEESLRQAGATVLRLRFDRGYHTPHYARKAERLKGLYEQLEAGPGRVPVFSCISLDWFPSDPAAIRELAVSQWVNPVRFREAVPRLYDHGVRTFVEVGPGGRLTGFVRDSLRGRKHRALASNLQGRSGIRHLQEVFAQLYASGRPLDPAPFFSGRRLEWPEGLGPEPGAPVSPPPTSGAERPRRAPAPLSSDGRLGVLERHLGLMQEFLESQARVHRMLSGLPWEPEPVAEAASGDEESSTPFLGSRIHRDEGRLVAEIDLDARAFPLLPQHTLGNRPSERRPDLTPLPVLPFAFATEMMAEAAEALAAPARAVRLEDVRGLRWLALDSGALTITLEARRVAADRVDVELFEVPPGGQARRLAYSCRAMLGGDFPPTPPPAAVPLEKTDGFTFSGAGFYSFVFHGPALRGIRQLQGLGPEGLEAEMVVPPSDTLVREARSPRMLAMPVLQDCAGQLVGFWLLEHHHMVDIGLYPFRLGCHHRHAPDPEPGAPLVCAARLSLEGRNTRATFDVREPSGRVLARIEDFQSRLYHLPPAFFKTLFALDAETYLSEGESWGQVRIRRVDCLTPDLLDQSWGIWQRALAHVVLGAAERVAWNALPEEEARGWLLARVAAKDGMREWAAAREVPFLPADLEILETPEGRLEARAPELEFLGPPPALDAAAGPGFGVAVLAPPDRRVGVAVAGDDLAGAAREAARRALGRGPGEGLRWMPQNSGAILALGEVEVEVRFRTWGDHTLALCAVPAALAAAPAAEPVAGGRERA